MVQKDYLLRQIEMMAVIIARIRDLAVGGDVRGAMKRLREDASQAGVELDLLDALTPESLPLIIGESNIVKLLPAAEILALKSELEGMLGEADASHSSLEKARVVTQRIEALVGDGADEALVERVRGLRERLG